MLRHIPSLDYAYRPGFSYEKWLEDRSHAEVVAKAIEVDMIERSEQMGGVLQSMHAMSEAQQGAFQSVCNGLDNVNDTLVWGFVEVVEGLAAVRGATREVKASVDQVNLSVRQLTEVVSVGFSTLTNSIGDVVASLDRIEDAVSDVQKAWAYANFRRAVRAIAAGYVNDAIRLLESSIFGDRDHAPYDLDARFYHILANCYAGAFPQEDVVHINLEQACAMYDHAIKYARMDGGVDASFEAACFAGSAWANYCLGRFETAAEQYGKSIRLESSFEREFGLLKSLLAAGNVDQARGVLRFCLLRHRNRFLIKAASDPDYIRHKALIQEERNELIGYIKEVTRTQYQDYSQVSKPLAHLLGESEKVIQTAGIESILKSVKSDFERLVLGESVRDLSFLDEGASELEIHALTSALSVAQSKVFAARDAEVRRLQGATAERKLDGRKNIHQKHLALVQQIEARICRRDASWGRYLVPFKRLLAADEERELSRLQAALATELAAFDQRWVAPNSDKHKRKFDALGSSLERLKIAVQRTSMGKAIQRKIDETCHELFSNSVLRSMPN